MDDEDTSTFLEKSKKLGKKTILVASLPGATVI
jgi:hypothetical protein